MEHKAIAAVKKHFADFDPKTFKLGDVDPNDTLGLDENDVEEALKDKVAELSDLQERLYAEKDWSLLVIFQAADGGGKDSAIKHVLSGTNPSGINVWSFSHPTSEDLSHDFLWRANKRLPERGKVAIFNRSYYEDVLAVRIFPDLLKEQHLPPKVITPNIWDERFEDINAFETHLMRNGTKICKFFLHVSLDEHKKRIMKRLTDPDKNWKFSPNDAKDRQHWSEFQNAVEDMIKNTSPEECPWKVVPANNKWVVHLAVATAMVDTLKELDLEFPQMDNKQLHQLRSLLATRARLEDR